MTCSPASRFASRPRHRSVARSYRKKPVARTTHRHVSPRRCIHLQAHCQSCHRPGEVGPFSLTTYKQAVNWSSDIKEYTRDRKMPPWKPSEASHPFATDRRLSIKDISTLAAWVDGGTPEGDPKDAPAAPSS